MLSLSLPACSHFDKKQCDVEPIDAEQLKPVEVDKYRIVVADNACARYPVPAYDLSWGEASVQYRRLYDVHKACLDSLESK